MDVLFVGCIAVLVHTYRVGQKNKATLIFLNSSVKN